MVNNISSWGKGIWDKKQTEQGSLGVIAGTIETKNIFDRQTVVEFKIMDRFIFPLLDKKAKIIDAGCGPFARFSIGFAKRGFEATGIDISPKVLSAAKKRVEFSGQNVKLLEDDLTDIKKVKEKQDLVFCYGTFGHVPAFLALRTLKGFNKILKNDGYAYIHFWINKEKTIKNILHDFAYDLGHYVKNKMGKGYKVNSSFYTEDEIKEMVRLSGFEVVKVIGDRYLLKKVQALKASS